MLTTIPTPYSADAADQADRLRLIVCDLRLVDAAVQTVVKDEDDRQAILMRLRGMIADVEGIQEDILLADQGGRKS